MCDPVQQRNLASHGIPEMRFELFHYQGNGFFYFFQRLHIRGESNPKSFRIRLRFFTTMKSQVIISEADFIGSFPSVDLCPKPVLPEYAFIGRSNVGKSSLINMLT